MSRVFTILWRLTLLLSVLILIAVTERLAVAMEAALYDDYLIEEEGVWQV